MKHGRYLRLFHSNTKKMRSNNSRRRHKSSSQIKSQHQKNNGRSRTIRTNRKDRNLFSSMVLNKGSKWSEHVVHDEVFFPKLPSQPFYNELSTRNHKDLNITELQNMWMTGFLHYEDDLKKKKVSFPTGYLFFLCNDYCKI